MILVFLGKEKNKIPKNMDGQVLFRLDLIHLVSIMVFDFLDNKL
jgi:hypothetical protein